MVSFGAGIFLPVFPWTSGRIPSRISASGVPQGMMQGTDASPVYKYGPARYPITEKMIDACGGRDEMESWKVFGIIVLACILLSWPVAACDVRIEKAGPADICTNGEYSYTLTVYYEGNANYQLKVKDTLPAGVTFISASDGGSLSGNDVTWKFSGPTYAVPAYSDYHSWWSKTLTVTVRNPGTSPVTNTAEVWYRSPGGSWTGHKTSNTVTTSFMDCYTTITKEAPERACTDCDLTYGIHVTYTGLNGKDVEVNDVLPAGVTFISASDGGTETAGTVSWNFAAVSDGWSRDLTLVVNPQSEGVLVNSAESSVDGVSATATSNTVLTDIIPCTEGPEFPTTVIPVTLIIGMVLIAGYVKRKVI